MKIIARYHATRRSRHFSSGTQVSFFFDEGILMNGFLGELFYAAFRPRHVNS
jgi:hypothetical protein